MAEPAKKAQRLADGAAPKPAAAAKEDAAVAGLGHRQRDGANVNVFSDGWGVVDEITAAPHTLLWEDACRPRVREDVVGQVAAQAGVREWLASRKTAACLLTGPTGCGKTSLATCELLAFDVTTDAEMGGEALVAQLTLLSERRGLGSRPLAVLLDTLEAVEGGQRAALVALLKAWNKTRPRHAPPILILVDDAYEPAYKALREVVHPRQVPLAGRRRRGPHCGAGGGLPGGDPSASPSSVHPPASHNIEPLMRRGRRGCVQLPTRRG
jgi:hypothetical protein